MVRLKTSKDYLIEYDKTKKMPADLIMSFCGIIVCGLIFVGAFFLLTGDVFSFGKNMPDFLNGIIRKNMIKEPVIHYYFENDGKISPAFIISLISVYALASMTLAVTFIKNKKLGITAIFFISVLLILVGVLYPLNVVEQLDYATGSMANSIKSVIETVRFNKGEPICEGNFAAKTGAGLTEEASLNIRMKNPQPYYLRGFVGEKYNGGGWSGLDSASIIEYNDVFIELHGAGFDGRTMMADINEIIKPSDTAQKIEIKNIGSNKKYFYLPYETENLYNESIDYIGDACYIADMPENSESYSFIAANYSVASVTDMRKVLADRQNEARFAAFLKNEYNYRLFCKENYTELPEETALNIAEFFESGEASCADKPLSVAEIKKTILECTKKFKYDESVVYSQEKGDFLEDFLENKRGYSIHFSSFAAAVFRYYGVPARFAEGYLVTDKDVEGKASGEIIELSQSSYHTWAEYYEDGIGWVPFEATPKYIGIMKSDNNISFSDAYVKPEEIKRTEREKPKHNLLINKEGEINKTASIILILLVALASYISFKLLKILIGKKGSRRTYSLRDINSGDNRRAIFAMMYHIKKIEKKYGLEPYISADAREIYEEAKYSNHEITAEKKDMMRRHYDGIKIKKNGKKLH